SSSRSSLPSSPRSTPAGERVDCSRPRRCAMSEAPTAEISADGPVVVAQALHKRFVEGSGASRLDVHVLRGVDLAVAAGETLAVVGASGSGKSTLLHLLGGLEAPTSGTVRLAGRDLATLGAAAQGEWRNRQLGFVYQFHHLLP